MKYLDKFVELTLKKGVNIQKGQKFELICPVEKCEIAHAFAKKAYDLGASWVNIRWEDQTIEKINYQGASLKTLKYVPQSLVVRRNELVKENYCYVAIDSDDPDAFNDIPTEKIATAISARSKKLKKFYDVVMKNGIRWCVVSIPTKPWADKIFGDTKDSEQKLEDAIIKAMRLDNENPVNAWENHVKKLDERAKKLNDFNFEYLVYKNSLGTDFKIGLADDHVWLSAQEKAQDGISFIANMPTEEVFTAPHCNKAWGVVKSALPLSYNGTVIEGISLEFKDGEVVNFSATKNQETLKKLINLDKGTKRLGEVALIGKNSPIAQSKILFFNTLFDENASCHLALGKAYPTTVKGQNSKSELSAMGLNDSVEHVDFMIGTADLSIIGITHDNKEITVFKDGEWAF